MFLPIQKSDIQKCASLYAQVFSSSPWSEPWTDEEADNRLRYLMDSKGFLGFLAEKDGKTIGFVLGTTEEMLFISAKCAFAPLNRDGALARN